MAMQTEKNKAAQDICSSESIRPDLTLKSEIFILIYLG